MQQRSLTHLSRAEFAARQARVELIARSVGFVGMVAYQHTLGLSGGAQYGQASVAERDVLLVDAEAFRRDAAGDDFTLAAIVAHERGHQLLCRHPGLRRNTPEDLSEVTEEVLASLIGAVVVGDARDGEALILKALGELVNHGMRTDDAQRHVEKVLTYLEAVL